MLAPPRSLPTLFVLSLITLLASLGVRWLSNQYTRSPLDHDVEQLLLSGHAKMGWDDWKEFDWAARGVKRKLKPRLPRRDQEMRDLVWGDVSAQAQ